MFRLVFVLLALTGPASFAIEGPTLPEGENPRAACGLWNGDGFFCSGTLIGARTVLTAAHCLEKTDAIDGDGIRVECGSLRTGIETSEVTRAILPREREGGKLLRRVEGLRKELEDETRKHMKKQDRAKISRLNKEISRLEDIDAGSDLAILRLGGRIGIEPLPWMRKDQSLTPEELARCRITGLTHEWVSLQGIPRTAEFEAGGIIEKRLEGPENPRAYGYARNLSAPGGRRPITAPGDSGGTLHCPLAGEWTLVGVHQGTFPRMRRTWDLALGTADRSDWIAEHAGR